MDERSKMMTMMGNMNSRMNRPHLMTNGNGQSEPSGRMNMPAMMTVDTSVRMDLPQMMRNGDRLYAFSGRMNEPAIMHVDTNVMSNSFIPMNLNNQHGINSNIRMNQLVNPIIYKSYQESVGLERIDLGQGTVEALGQHKLLHQMDSEVFPGMKIPTY
ncbi:Hypothetical predicted protein [Mytilus galloprovincialis]|uniref:Uncharacterized protein n=1 Tax=Mytilus galloprovincialis TaxID=29158 RepID=A0A8B6ENV7_MYTGA|nr:Hypothetical predicted protein [Mytilus galloprovincialis]